MTLLSSVTNRNVLIVGGAGGVGKTTTSAALAVGAANHTDRRVLVVTMDPARRLADVLGVELGGHIPSPVKTKGNLSALMLDAKSSWDDLVRRHAPERKIADDILNNPLYEDITARFVQSHDYIAMEMLYQWHQSGAYDLIIVDTPPAAHAVDFLDAPDRMASFFDSRLLKFLVAPARASLRSVTSRAFLQLADRLLGKRFLADITELFSMLETMRPGFIERANSVRDLLRAETTAFVAVTTPEPNPVRSAQQFATTLQERSLHQDGVILNRALPSFLHDAVPETNGVDDSRIAKVLTSNYRRLGALARAQKSALDGSGMLPVVEIPLMAEDTSNIAVLEKLGARLLGEQ